MSRKYKILFVCLGNICRSPSAEAVFFDLIEKEGFGDRIAVDSAGIVGYHAGEGADTRMKRHAALRGYRLTSRSRPVMAEDFDQFDLIVGMDDQNMKDLHRKKNETNCRAEIRKMTDFCTCFEDTEVPDPYYGGASGFEHVLDLLEDASNGLMRYVQQKIGRE